MLDRNFEIFWIEHVKGIFVMEYAWLMIATSFSLCSKIILLIIIVNAQLVDYNVSVESLVMCNV